MRYGLPFQGSKNKLAERIISVLPRDGHFYDIFAGGCAISHCALLSGKWKHIHMSDISDSVLLFRDFLEGNIPDGSEWISREEFYRRRDSDAYVRIVWSFANNQRNYIYSKEIEPYKKAVHEMIYAPTPNERRLKFKEVCRLMHKLYMSENKENTLHSTATCLQTRIEQPEILCRLQSSERVERLPHPTQLSDIQRSASVRDSLAILKSCQRDNRGREVLQWRPFFRVEYDVKVCDYREIEILPDSIIYCDIPYKGTCGYRFDTFDHDAFYDWAERQEVPVFISEYWMPEDRFKVIAQWDRVSTFSATNNGLRKTEKLFVPSRWHDKFKPVEQKSLFDNL